MPGIGQTVTMAVDTKQSIGRSVFNLPNQLTVARLIVSVVLFCLIALDHYLYAMLAFILAASTDWLDGYFARKYGLVTVLGRILDPFADKVIICGTFIFLVAEPQLTDMPWGLRPWMVVVVVGRELLVTALRSFLERQGSDFSASMSGKLKMVLQCIAAAVCLFYLYQVNPSDGANVAVASPGLAAAVAASVWASVLLTIWSGVGYIFAAVRMVKT